MNAPDGSAIIGGWGSLPCRGNNGSPTKPTVSASPRASLGTAPPPPPAKSNRKTLSPARFFSSSKHKTSSASPQKNAFEMGSREATEIPQLRMPGLKINVPTGQDVDDINMFSPKDIPASPWMRGVDAMAPGTPALLFADITLLSGTYDWNR